MFFLEVFFGKEQKGSYVYVYIYYTVFVPKKHKGWKNVSFVCSKGFFLLPMEKMVGDNTQPQAMQFQMSHGSKNPPTFHYTGWLILLMAEILHHLGCMKPYK